MYINRLVVYAIIGKVHLPSFYKLLLMNIYLPFISDYCCTLAFLLYKRLLMYVFPPVMLAITGVYKASCYVSDYRCKFTILLHKRSLMNTYFLLHKRF